MCCIREKIGTFGCKNLAFDNCNISTLHMEQLGIWHQCSAMMFNRCRFVTNGAKWEFDEDTYLKSPPNHSITALFYQCDGIHRIARKRFASRCQKVYLIDTFLNYKSISGLRDVCDALREMGQWPQITHIKAILCVSDHFIKKNIKSLTNMIDKNHKQAISRKILNDENELLPYPFVSFEVVLVLAKTTMTKIFKLNHPSHTQTTEELKKWQKQIEEAKTKEDWVKKQSALCGLTQNIVNRWFNIT